MLRIKSIDLYWKRHLAMAVRRNLAIFTDRHRFMHLKVEQKIHMYCITIHYMIVSIWFIYYFRKCCDSIGTLSSKCACSNVSFSFMFNNLWLMQLVTETKFRRIYCITSSGISLNIFSHFWGDTSVHYNTNYINWIITKIKVEWYCP